MDEGFALCELVVDEAGHVVDYRYLDLDHEAEALMGLRREDAIGRLRSDVLHQGDDRWIALCAHVVASGQAARAESYSTALDRWFDVRVLPRGGTRFALFYEDVTERKRAETSR